MLESAPRMSSCPASRRPIRGTLHVVRRLPSTEHSLDGFSLIGALRAAPSASLLIFAISLATSGCSALTGFAGLSFNDDAAAGGPDAPPARDAGSGVDAARPDDAGAARDTGTTSMDGDAPPPIDGGPAARDGGPPQLDMAPPPVDLGPPPADTAAVECRTSSQCDDFNACTTDMCTIATGTCTNAPTSGGSCNDGNACTTIDRCEMGVCVGQDPLSCTPSGPCVTASCDPAFGCVEQHAEAGVACDDLHACSPSSTCDGAGVCSGPFVCPSDGNACTEDVCMGPACAAIPVANGTMCPGGGCCGGVCMDTQTDELNCGLCARACMDGESCVMGRCMTACGPTGACDDGLSCTSDVCSGTCVNTVMSGFCVIGGACVAANTANPANPCQQCRPALAQRAWSPAPGSPPCEDGRFCTSNDTCSEGVCVGGPDPCPLMNLDCFVFTCNESTDRCTPNRGCPTPTVCCADGVTCGLPGVCG